MDCTIEWQPPTDAKWDEIFASLRRSTLLQSRPYAEAICPALGQSARRAIIRLAGTPAGLVQIQEASLCRRAIHALILDRGPLWCPGFGAAAHIEAFFAELTRLFPARFGRRRRVIPEVLERDTPLLSRLSLTPLADRPGYRTIWVDLTPEPGTLRKSLHGKWRNALSKAERAAITVDWDWSGASLEPFLALYAEDKAAKGYPGPDPATLRRLAATFAPTGALALGIALQNGRPLAGLLLLLHGQAATYQTGWVTEAGRNAAANHLLLWQAMLTLKSRGIADLDLGGLSPDPASAGIARFKSGLGGTPVTLAGHYR